MKKFLAAILALFLLLSVTSSVFAITIDDTSNSAQVGIQAKYNISDATATTISVDIDWSGLSFTYNGAEQIWDATNHTYVESATTGSWEASDAKINITNHSDVILKADLDYVANDGFDSTDMVFTDDTPFIGSAYTDSSVGTPCSVTISVIPSGTLPNTATTATSIGNIVISVAAIGDTSATTMITKLTDLYESACENSANIENLPRGTIYLRSQEAMDEVSLVMEAFLSIAEDADEASYNAHLNQFITTLYNCLTIKQ